MRPSGAQTIDHGTSSPLTTVSTRNLPAPDCVVPWSPAVDSTSPAPRPGGGCPQANANITSAQKTTNKGLSFAVITRSAFDKTSMSSSRVVKNPESMLDVFVQQFNLVTLFAEFHPHQVAHRKHA